MQVWLEIRGFFIRRPSLDFYRPGRAAVKATFPSDSAFKCVFSCLARLNMPYGCSILTVSDMIESLSLFSAAAQIVYMKNTELFSLRQLALHHFPLIFLEMNFSIFNGMQVFKKKTTTFIYTMTGRLLVMEVYNFDKYGGPLQCDFEYFNGK